MPKIVDETTVHGVKDAWYANRIGRVFWVAVFISCITAMVFQLEGLFEAFNDESVGTQVSQTINSEFLEVPAFYYHNTMWLSDKKGMKKLLSATDTGQDLNLYEMLDGKCGWELGDRRYVDAPPIFSEDGTDCTPYYQYWKSQMTEELVNMLLPLDQETAETSGKQADRWFRFYDRKEDDLWKNVVEKIRTNHDGSLTKFIESNTIDGDNPFHGILPFQIKVLLSADSYLDQPPQDRFEDAPHRPKWTMMRWGSVIANLNGVGWKVTPSRNFVSKQKLSSALGRKYRHTVLHMGGFGSQLREVAEKYGIWQAIGLSWRYHGDRDATFVSIGSHASTPLYFKERFRLDSGKLRADVKFWTKKSIFRNRKTFQCKEKNWTVMDQAHCNQNRALRQMTNEIICEQYLPATANFPETKVTNSTCLYDYFRFFLSRGEAPDGRDFFEKINSKRISFEEPQAVVNRLLQTSVDCPKPCVQTDFNFEVSYKEPDIGDMNDCYWAIGSVLAKKGDNEQEWKMNLEGAFNEVKGVRFGEDQKFALPCTVVHYEQTESHGIVFEEYPLYSLSDLAASIGGTVGLWMGASAISVVQVIYICCLKKAFAKAQNKIGGVSTRKI